MKRIAIGIESTAHTLGIGIFDASSKAIISNSYSTYSKKYGGMKPSDVADHHSQAFEQVLKKSLDDASINIFDAKVIGYSKGPGLAPCLRIARTSAVLISSILRIPVIPVHHGIAHILIGKFDAGLVDPLVIYASGANTQLLIEKQGAFAVMGETLDIGLGNAIDMLARAMKLENAHGSSIEFLAKNGDYIELPYTVKGMDFTFSGLVTRCGQLLNKHAINDVAHSFQETAFAMLCEAAERALMLSKKHEVLLCGGVAQNKRLQEMVSKMCEENGVAFGVAKSEYNRDNGAMIAYAASYLFDKFGNSYPDKDISIKPKFRIEDAFV